jgi:hypothetical protein
MRTHFGAFTFFFFLGLVRPLSDHIKPQKIVRFELVDPDFVEVWYIYDI